MTWQRELTRRERRIYTGAFESLQELERRLFGLKLLNENLAIACAFYEREIGACPYSAQLAGRQRLLIYAIEIWRRVAKAIALVEQGELVLAFNQLGEMSIGARPEDLELYKSIIVKPEELAPLYNRGNPGATLDGVGGLGGLGVMVDRGYLGGGPAVGVIVVIAIIGGVLVTIGALWAFVKWMESDDQSEFNELAARFCKDPGSPLCRKWLELRKQKIEANKDFWDEIAGAAKAGVGVAGAVLIGLFAFSMIGKKNGKA